MRMCCLNVELLKDPGLQGVVEDHIDQYFTKTKTNASNSVLELDALKGAISDLHLKTTCKAKQVLLKEDVIRFSPAKLPRSDVLKVSSGTRHFRLGMVCAKMDKCQGAVVLCSCAGEVT
ncbi:hypothetical protein NDU88_002202 [Pleurodeles waltl]|uniref:Interleukin-1 beta n=1 Tax=Pleurodeles waltl TaxID=8319 RepID=A0AAV7W3D8_PLEWA|nr:hypothetical protein NDU88_002202 [Pleurodeles waltl]